MNDCFKNLEKQLEIFKKHDGKINLGLVACEAHLVDLLGNNKEKFTFEYDDTILSPERFGLFLNNGCKLF